MTNSCAPFVRLFAVFSLLIILVIPVSVNAQTPPVSFVTHHDTIPNFAYTPTITSTKDGNWSDPTVWSLARVPDSSDVVLINHVVAYDSMDGTAHTIGIGAGGKLAFKTDQNTRLSVGTLQVQPQGTLEVGTEANPIPSNVTAEIVIRDIPIDTTNDGQGVYDPFQFGTGILAIDAMVTMHGAVKSPTFLRLAAEPHAGDATLTLESAPSGWKAGDKLILPDTRQLRKSDLTNKTVPGTLTPALRPTQTMWEELVVSSVSGDVVTLTAPFQFDHKGARDADGSIRFMPHVGNLSRNILIHSENPAGTRGHTLFTQHADVQIFNTLFKDLGRTKVIPLKSTVANLDGTFVIGTNQIGRYALHLHHVIGPLSGVIPANGYQFTLEGNAIDGSPKWGIATHNSHYGLVKDNVVYNAIGAGFVTEDGSETSNVIDHNFSVRSEGSGGGSERGPAGDFGHEGVGFWFHRVNNYVRNNVSANAQSSAFNVFSKDLFLSKIKYPKYQGANTAIAGQYAQSVNIGATPLEFNNNESYGSVGNGFEFWVVGTSAIPFKMTGASAWHNRVGQFIPFFGGHLVLDGFVARGDWDIARTKLLVAPNVSESMGVTTGTYGVDTLMVKNADIQGFAYGVRIDEHPKITSSLVIENGFFRNAYNIVLPAASNLYETADIRNVRYAAVSGYPLRTVILQGGVSVSVPHPVRIYSHNGVNGDDFEVLRIEQAPSGVAFKDGTYTATILANSAIGVPESGLTNTETKAKYDMALGGVVACTVMRPDVVGYVCPQTPQGPEDNTKPSSASNLTATAISPTDIDLSWTAATDNVKVLGYFINGSYPTSAKTLFRRMASAETTYRMSNLKPDTSYKFSLQTFDSSFNQSGGSGAATALTLSGPATNDTQPPSVPTGLIATPVSDWQINLSWNPSTDNTGVVGYHIFESVGNLLRGASVSPAFPVGGLFLPNTQYCFKVAALDAADNKSALSAPVCGRTLP